MELFVKPETIICENGSIRIDVQDITPEYIDNHIKDIEAVGKLDSGEVIDVIRKCNSDEANNSLVSRFNITHQVADFILNMGLAECSEYMGHYEFCKSEIAK